MIAIVIVLILPIIIRGGLGENHPTHSSIHPFTLSPSLPSP